MQKGTINVSDKTYYDSNKNAININQVQRTFYYYNCASCNNGLATKPIVDTSGATTGLIIPMVIFPTTITSNQCDWC